MKKFVCLVCGYVYEGDELPEGFKCPICGVSGEKFQVVEGDLKLAAEHEFGIGTKLDPKGNATRAQVAAMLRRFIQRNF